MGWLWLWVSGSDGGVRTSYACGWRAARTFFGPTKVRKSCLSSRPIYRRSPTVQRLVMAASAACEIKYQRVNGNEAVSGGKKRLPSQTK